MRLDCNRAQGRNRAIEKASHPIIAVSDAGCSLSKHWLRNITEPFKNKTVDVVSGYYQPGDGNVFQKSVAAYTCVMPDKVNDAYLPSSRSIAFRKASWNRVGGYPEDLDYCEDLIFARRMRDVGLYFELKKGALVTWPQESTWFAVAEQLFMYARGDGQALYVRPQTPFLFGRYVVAAGALLMGFYYPAAWIFLIAAFVLYILWAVQKNYRYVRHPYALIVLPALQLVADVAVMTGMSIGIADRAPIAKATAWQFIGKIGAALCGLAAFSLLARSLSPSGMSTYSYIISMSILLMTVADFGIDSLIMREAAHRRDAVVSRYLGLRALLASSMIAISVFGGISFMIAGISHAFFLLSNGLIAYQKGKKAFFSAAKSQIIFALIMFTALAIGSMRGASVEALLLLGALASGISFFFVKRSIPLSIHMSSFGILRTSLLEILPFGLASLISVAYFRLDVIFLGYYYPPEIFSDVGMYAVAYRPFELAIVIGGLYTQTLLPFMKSVTKDTIFKTLGLAGGLGLLLYITAPFLIHIIGGDQFISSVLSLRILSLGAIFTILAGYAYTIVIVHKREKFILYSSLTTLLVNILCNILLIPSHSYIGASWATVITQGTLFITASLAALYSLKLTRGPHR